MNDYNDNPTGANPESCLGVIFDYFFAVFFIALIIAIIILSRKAI